MKSVIDGDSDSPVRTSVISQSTSQICAAMAELGMRWTPGMQHLMTRQLRNDAAWHLRRLHTCADLNKQLKLPMSGLTCFSVKPAAYAQIG